MFRLFLRKKLFAGADAATGVKRDTRPGKGSTASAAASAKTSKKNPPAADETPRRNRRVFARYAVDHKHLTLMNAQDILLVREISAKGFSTEVSPRGFERLCVGDVYDARFRYLGEIHSLQARVAWKQEQFVGFEIMQAEPGTLQFIKRLLRPIAIATSLQPVESTFMSEGNIGKTWYHGDDESDLFTWHHPETSELKAWQLTVGNEYIEWTENRGLATGNVMPVKDKKTTHQSYLGHPAHAQDAGVDGKKRQLAVDIVMALQNEVREEILETFAG